MKHITVFLLLAVALSSCLKESEEPVLLSDLEAYLTANNTVQRDILIACATGESERIGTLVEPINVFFYPVQGALSPHLYVSNATDADDLGQYQEIARPLFDVFNGRLNRFSCEDLDARWAIVTYTSPGKVHVSDPMLIKYDSTPTYFIDSLTTVVESGVNPQFDWTAENEPNNIIYFQVISDTLGNVISGTYTQDKFWNFYDLSNVVLNLNDTAVTPTLQAGSTYDFTLMGVSDDNWVHTVAMKRFQTF